MVLLKEELSKSRTGKHAVRDIVLVVDLSSGEIKSAKPKRREETQPVYRRGKAYFVLLSLPENHVAVQVHLVRNLRGVVKGFIEVYNREGIKLYRAVYRKLKLRYSCGDPYYAWVVELVTKKLGLPVKNTNLDSPKRTKCR